ncbi:MAG: TetR/AcrR family transcriptional regulator [Deltaproteobacteria bacterium]|nr:TetR/AcrR family transcriptional regulator [Deltaproteobacteria bacterium]
MRVDFLAQQMAERRERILAAAREIIGQRGYEALTMRDLARASRVTVPTVYNLVGSKEEVLFAAIEEQTQRFEAGLRGGSELPPAQRVIAIVDAAATEYLRMPRYYSTLLTLLFISDSAHAMRQRVDRAISTPMGEALAAMRDAGELASWIELRPLRGRLRAHLQMTSLQWAVGGITDDGLRAAARYGAALLMTAATTGATRSHYEGVARAAQSGAIGRAPDEPQAARSSP